MSLPGHPQTLVSASNLALCLRALGEVRVARDLYQDTLDRRRRVLGEDHPDTRRSARNLAADLSALNGGDETRDAVRTHFYTGVGHCDTACRVAERDETGRP